MRSQPAEVRRSLICLVLGWPRHLRVPLCGGCIKDLADDFSDLVRSRVDPVYAASAEAKVSTTLKLMASPFKLLSECVPLDCVDLATGKIKKEAWEEWLGVCWGHDSDTLSLLSLLHTLRSETDSAKLVSIARDLPVVQSPSVSFSSNERLVDAHIHAGALYPPVFQWANHMNLGTLIHDETVGGHRYSELFRSLQYYRIVARGLLAAMLDFYSACLPTGRFAVEVSASNEQKELLKRIVVLLDRKGKRQDLVRLLVEVLNKHRTNVQSHRAEQAFVSVPLEDIPLAEFVRRERECVASLLWYAHRGQLPIFFQEALVSYLRCKGQWFQTNCGVGLPFREEGVGLSGFRRLRRRLASVAPKTSHRYHLHMERPVNQYYKASSAKWFEVRVGCMDRRKIDEALDWLDRLLRGLDWRLVLGLRRHEFHLSETSHDIDDLREDIFRFVDRVLTLENGRYRQRVIGVDVVGPERDVDWLKYVPIVREVRQHIGSETGQSCFVAFHCGEDTVAPLKGIADMWYVIWKCGLGAGDRIGHGIDLLDPNRRRGHGPVHLLKDQWKVVEDSLTNILASYQDEASLECFEKLKDPLATSQVALDLSGELAFNLACRIQPFVIQTLCEKRIVVETCPTSNWRIAGIPRPTEHPIASWIDLGGDYHVGTDDPAIFPCTIESEYYSVSCSVNHLSSNT